MEDNSDYKNGFPKIDVSKDSVLNMLTKVAAFKMEERDLALDRFKRVNEGMADESEFWAHGKSAILYLDSVSKSSNYLGDLARDVMKIVFKEEASSDGANGQAMGNEDKRRLEEIAEAYMKNKRKRDGSQDRLQLPSDSE